GAKSASRAKSPSGLRTAFSTMAPARTAPPVQYAQPEARFAIGSERTKRSQSAVGYMFSSLPGESGFESSQSRFDDMVRSWRTVIASFGFATSGKKSRSG